ncbi:hypothetical protein EWM64_g3248 [Hericium alpestre]|uniref:Uncharacterized protein n=1 Tax=Hericium alpestre TaxID=135208 RepID=A0A4Z0A2U8_9AGAM|nr:hypothetical protein EWM64_g3248 [Hericium alpestre]
MTCFTSLLRFQTPGSASATSALNVLSLSPSRDAEQLIYLHAGEADTNTDSEFTTLVLLVAASKLLAKFASAFEPISPWAAWSDCVVSIDMWPWISNETGVHCVAGMRFVQPHTFWTEDGPLSLVVKDCNAPRVVRQAGYLLLKRTMSRRVIGRMKR